MRILAVETATSWHSVAIVDDDRVLASHDEDGTGAHGQMLLPTIDRLLTETGLCLADLEGFACSIGPGSFTGIRVGLATCLGLRRAVDRPLAVVPTLEAMAWMVNDERFPICPVVTSRKGEVYWAVFRWKAGVLERIVPEHVGSPTALGESLMEPTVLFGNGWTAMEAEIRQALAPQAAPVDVHPPVGRPSAAAVAALALNKLRRGEAAPLHVMPLYVQRAEAELKYEQSGGQSPVARRQERVKRKMAERLARRGKPGRRTRATDG